MKNIMMGSDVEMCGDHVDAKDRSNDLLSRAEKLLTDVCKAWAKAGQSNSGYCFDVGANYAIQSAREKETELRNIIRELSKAR
jgi:hypothetical protein